jgi:hypothetical protein
LILIIVILLTHGFFFLTLPGNAYGSYETPKLTFSGRVALKPGVNKLALLSSTVGLPVSVLIIPDQSTLFQNVLVGRGTSHFVLIFD